MSLCKYISEKIKRWDKSKLKVLWLVNFVVSRSKIKKKKGLWHVREVLTLLWCHVLLLFWVRYCQFLVAFTDWFCFFSYVNESEGQTFLIYLYLRKFQRSQGGQLPPLDPPWLRPCFYWRIIFIRNVCECKKEWLWERGVNILFERCSEAQT